MVLFLGLMLLLLPFAFSLPTLAEDNPPEAVINPDAGENPVIPGSGNELPPTPDSDSNSNNGNSGTPAANPGQPGTPGNDAPGTGTQNPENSDADTKISITPDKPAVPFTDPNFATLEESVIGPEVAGITVTPVPAGNFSESVRKSPIQKAPPEVIKIDNTNFPDDNFRKSYVKLWDINNDDILSKEESSHTIEFLLHYPDLPVADLRGLEYFTSLESLTIYKQPVSKLDVRPFSYLTELTVDQSAVSEITFGHNPFLGWLICSKNKLTSVDVSTLNNLCVCSFDNNQLTNLTLGKHPQLKDLYCNNNFLRMLSLNHCENLEELICHDNQLTTLDLSNNPILDGIDISNNLLTSLDVSQNPQLYYLDISKNQVTSLDVRQNPQLGYLYISNNHLTSLDLSKNDKLSAKDFKGKHQTYSIEVDRDTLEFDLSSLPGNFIPARASEWKGASISGMTLNLDPSMPSTVTYNYNADTNRDGFIMDVTLFVTYVSKNILIPCPYGAVMCPTQPAYQTIPLTPVPVQQMPADNIQGQVAQLPKTGEQDSRAVALGSLVLLSLGAFLVISRRK